MEEENKKDDETPEFTKETDDIKQDIDTKAVTDNKEEKSEEEQKPLQETQQSQIQEIPKDNKNNKTTTFIIIGIIVLLAIFGVIKMTGNTIKSESTKVLLETSMGDITIELYNDMPITVGNFKALVEKGTYDGVIFHRVIDGFMIQGGDPTGTGFGDPNIPNIKDEFTHEGGNKNLKGTLSMANAGPNTGSSQFFIHLAYTTFLDGKHPTFGVVIGGMDIVEKIAKVSKDSQDRPLEEVTIMKASII